MGLKQYSLLTKLNSCPSLSSINTLTCEASGGDVTLGPVTGRFEVTFSVTPNSPVTLVNPAGVCQVDPDGNVIENDESDNNCPANVIDVVVSTTFVYLPFVQR